MISIKIRSYEKIGGNSENVATNDCSNFFFFFFFFLKYVIDSLLSFLFKFQGIISLRSSVYLDVLGLGPDIVKLFFCLVNRKVTLMFAVFGV